MVNVTINGVSMKFRVDTGADVTVISSGDYAILREPELLHTDKVLTNKLSKKYMLQIFFFSRFWGGQQ